MYTIGLSTREHYVRIQPHTYLHFPHAVLDDVTDLVVDVLLPGVLAARARGVGEEVLLEGDVVVLLGVALIVDLVVLQHVDLA